MFILTTNSRKLSFNAIIQAIISSVLDISLISSSQSMHTIEINVPHLSALDQAKLHAAGMIVPSKQKSAYKHEGRYMFGLIFKA